MFDPIRRGIRRRPSTGPLIGALALAAVVAGGAYAAIPAANGQIKGCYATANGILFGIPHTKGDLRAVDSAESCRSYERAVTWSQAGVQGPTGPKGDVGVQGGIGPTGPKGDPGSAGLSGYEVVERRYDDQPLPIDDTFGANCPSGKRVLGGGALVQLYSPTAFAGLGSAPKYSIPDSGSVDGGGWIVWLTQASVSGATTARITVMATCASVGS